MKDNRSQYEQLIFCTKHKNHPKKDLNVCMECELNSNCQTFYEYRQPGPWVKIDEKATANSNIKRVSLEEPVAICSKCRHYHGGSKCEAYPDKIPTEILLGYVSHTKPYRNDHGIQFEPIDGPGRHHHPIKED